MFQRLLMIAIAVALIYACQKEYSFESRNIAVPPVSRAGNDQLISLPKDSAVLDGHLSSDLDGTIVSYAWNKISGPASGNITDRYSPTTIVRQLSFGIYLFELTVTDDDSLSAKDTVIITVTNGSDAPVAKAGVDIQSYPYDTVILNGNSSTDIDNNISGYYWRKLSGPSPMHATGQAGSKLSFWSEVEGEYIYELTVTDSTGLSSSDTVKVTMQPSYALVINQWNISISLPLDSVFLDGFSHCCATANWTQAAGPSNATIINGQYYLARAKDLIPGYYAFELRSNGQLVTTVGVQVFNDAANANEITYYDLPWIITFAGSPDVSMFSPYQPNSTRISLAAGGNNLYLKMDTSNTFAQLPASGAGATYVSGSVGSHIYVGRAAPTTDPGWLSRTASLKVKF